MRTRITPLCPPTPFRLHERDDGQGGSKSVTENPTWNGIAAAIGRLDNESFTDVSIEYGEGADATNMLVSGGRDERVVCCVARPDDPGWGQDFRHVVDREWRQGTFEQVIGGQESDLPAMLSVPRETALQAARYFVEHRALDPELDWKIP
ncbi:MAG: hypothetical protein HYV09_27810 [Deltaproteobacteria bacterium]|nr:hypothetical protein [Deltaproteobacteria bacterium]